MKILRIDKCIQCPYCQSEKGNMRCHHPTVNMGYFDGIIPEWCPLDDAPSEFCECEHPLPATRTTIGVCIICDKRIECYNGNVVAKSLGGI